MGNKFALDWFACCRNILAYQICKQKKMKKIKLTIEGMHCASCASNIERAVKKVKGVKEVVVSLMTNKAFIEIDEDVNREEIKKAIGKVGYKVVDIEE